jgi:quinol-cytochrome oxidoreductase complex cytochrome b subunit
VGRLARALRERLPVSPESIRARTNEPVPNHLKRWWFALGGTPAYLFVVQIVTGIMLAFGVVAQWKGSTHAAERRRMCRLPPGERRRAGRVLTLQRDHCRGRHPQGF